MNTTESREQQAPAGRNGFRFAKVIGLAVAIAVAGSGPAVTAHAVSPDALVAPSTAPVQAGSELAPSAELAEAFTQLVESDTPRATATRGDVVEHTFTVPVPVQTESDSPEVSVTVGIPIEERLGAGSDRHGPYYLLNNFDQQVIANGAAATVAAGLCAIPAVGTVSCVAIQAAIAVAAAWISQHGLCPQNLKGYFFNNGIRPSCVKY